MTTVRSGGAFDHVVTRRRFLGGVAAVAAGAVLEACTPSTGRGSTEPATSGEDLVLRNATVLTMDPAHPQADAVAVSGDLIVAVGAEADVVAAARPGATVIDLGGRVVLPGFNDAHCHRIGDRDVSGYPSAEAAIEDALAGGWTSISELFVDQERLDELRQLDEAGRLRLRVNGYLPVNYLDDKFGVWFGDYRPHQKVSPNVRIGGVKIFADSAWTNEMLMTEPHSDRPGDRGVGYWTGAELTTLVRTLHDDGWQMATHTAGDAAHDMVLDAYEAALAGADGALHRHRIEHVMAVRDDQLVRMRDLAVIASFQLTWFTTDTTPDVATTVGPERLPWIGRWRDLLEAGVVAVASTDYPYDDLAAASDTENGRAMKALSVAVTRIAPSGVAAEPWQANQTITVEQGLPLMTRAGAYATFEEDQKGTITKGKLADLVVLSEDPRQVAVDRLADVKVLVTMVGGRVEYRAPEAAALW